MKYKKKIWLFFLVVTSAITACDSKRVYEENTNIENEQWNFEHRPFFDVYITDTTQYYNICVNLRIASTYKYNNIFLLLHTTNPSKQTETKRVELRLANETGKWTGSGLGDIYDYTYPVYRKIKIKEPGFYRIEVEQNMRDDVLESIKSTGIRVEVHTTD
jgi:gliding motility-associated lipoprotein GldH